MVPVSILLVELLLAFVVVVSAYNHDYTDGMTALDTAESRHHNATVRKLRDTCGQPPPECSFPFSYGYDQYYSCTDLGMQTWECSCMDADTNLYRCQTWDKMCADDEYESFDYSKFHSHHSVVFPRRPECKHKESGVTEEEKRYILQAHNGLRSKVARGLEDRSPSGESQPKASNMKELTWNNELAYIAQKWADVCIYSHEIYFQPTHNSHEKMNLCSRNYRFGQNLFFHTSPNIREMAWSTAIKAWYDEVVDVPVSLASNYNQRNLDPTKKIGHYTQMMWASTYEIGCGAVYFTEGGFPVKGKTYMTRGTILICNYGPGGNIQNNAVYKTGKTISGCGEAGRSKVYPNLCASTDAPTK